MAAAERLQAALVKYMRALWWMIARPTDTGLNAAWVDGLRLHLVAPDLQRALVKAAPPSDGGTLSDTDTTTTASDSTAALSNEKGTMFPPSEVSTASHVGLVCHGRRGAL
jgi:hypothetical protein